jgi:glutamine synthetase
MKQSKEKIIEMIKDSPNPKVKVAITDIDGVLRGKYLHKDKFLSIIESGFGFCDVVFGWDINDLAYDHSGIEFTGWHTGYPDANAHLDLNTFRRVPWDYDVPFFLGDFNVDVCPRHLLRKIKASAEKQGYKASFGQEFEWFNFRETAEEMAGKDFQKPTPLSPGMFGYSVLRMSNNCEFFNDIYDLLMRFDVPLEGLHTETGPGVFEAALLYDDVLESADRAVLFKSSVKEIGHRHNIMPTFMAKISENLPGCSGHLHQSLWEGGRNLFHDEKSPNKMSPLMESYCAGLLFGMPQVLPMYAPTINSYKRLVEGAWAPTTVTWAIDNRTVAVRALPGGAKSSRLELRVVGSDTNPYLAHAAALACGLYGIKNKLKLQTATKGNGYRDISHGVLPRNLWDATQAMKGSKLANDMFGENFVKHFCATREWEVRQFQKSVTDWEYKRYFEIV